MPLSKIGSNQIGDDAVGTTELANDVVINTSSTNTTLGSFVNSSSHNTNNGVVHVKQSAATNLPTMVVEQTGEGGNPGDKQGLLIKGAGQNQGDGLMLGVEATNSNLASGNTFRPFSVWNGGFVAVENKNNETSWQINKEGLVQEVQIPAAQNSMNINGMNQTVSGNADYVVTGLTSAYYNSNSLNNKSYFNSSTSRFTVPSGALTCHYFVHFQTLLGITLPSSGNHYGYLAIRKNGTGASNKPVEAYRQVNASTDTSTISWETLAVSCVVKLAATDYIEPVFSGSNVSIRIHSGTYTSFNVIKIG
tara:strand:- start:4815 stop:5732 length:918 start_codon:yes stop_codon:yes gene_type:complete